MLDGVDSFIYALVLVPAMKDLLPASGVEPSAGNLGYYGSILFSMFLIGWGLAFLWGPLADRFGRVRALMGWSTLRASGVGGRSLAQRCPITCFCLSRAAKAAVARACFLPRFRGMARARCG